MRGGRNDHPLKWLNTFTIKIMNFMKKNIPSLKNICIEFSKFWRISADIPGQRNSCFIKIHEFYTNRFFVFEIRKKFGKKFTKGFARKTPCQEISMVNIFGTTFNKMDLTSKSFQYPFKNREFGITALNKDFINKVFSVFLIVSENSKRTFSINKTRKIRIVQIKRNNCRDVCRKGTLICFFNQIAFIFNFPKSIHQNFFFYARRRFNKFAVNFSLFPFFNEKRNNLLNVVYGFFSSQNKMILRFPFFRSFSSIGYSSNARKSFDKKLDYVSIRGRNDERTRIFCSSCGVTDCFSNMKTSIAISVSSNVS